MTDTKTKLGTAQDLFEYLSKFTKEKRQLIYLEAHDLDDWNVIERVTTFSDGSKSTDLVIADKPTAPALRVYLEGNAGRFTIREGVIEDVNGMGDWVNGQTVRNWQNLKPGDRLWFDETNFLKYPVQTVSTID